jgi:hypothetical protein
MMQVGQNKSEIVPVGSDALTEMADALWGMV